MATNSNDTPRLTPEQEAEIRQAIAAEKPDRYHDHSALLLAEIDALRNELSELRNAAGFSLDEVLGRYSLALKPIVPHGKPDTNGGAE